MTDSRFDVEPNPLATTLGNDADQLLTDIHNASRMLEVCGPCGIQISNHRTDPYRPSTNEESCFAEVDICTSTLAIDLRKPVPQQVSKWLRRIARHLLSSANRIDLIEDGRDLRAVRKLVKVPEVA